MDEHRLKPSAVLVTRLMDQVCLNPGESGNSLLFTEAEAKAGTLLFGSDSKINQN